MGRASSEEKIGDSEIDEMEDIAKNLPKGSVSHDASDRFILSKLIELQPELVPIEFYEAYEKKLQGDPEYSSQAKVQEKLDSSKGTVWRHFKAISDEIAKMRDEAFETGAEEIPALTQERTAQILKNGKHVQLNPYDLLPPKGHKNYEPSRYFQRRRGPRQHPLENLADSIAQIGMIEPPTVQYPSSDNGFFQRIADGFNRDEAWILANEKLGGTAEKPALEFPVHVVVECTNAEGELIALEKNQNKDNFDVGDRDYSIVLMYENHPQVYTQKKLTEIFNLSKQVVHNIISAWRESWPPNEKKGETVTNNPIRQALIDRKITTYHGRLLSQLKKWPSEQRRLGRWLLDNAAKSGRQDALIIDYQTVKRGEDQGKFIDFSYDYSGISSGQLGSMVNSSVRKMQNAETVKTEVSKLLKDGKIDSKISEKEYSRLQNKFGSFTKGSIDMGLKDAGIKVHARVPEPESDRRIGPATVEKVTSKVETLPERKSVIVCKNCQAYYEDDIETLSRCLLGIAPTEDNECVVHDVIPGRPKTIDCKCSHCGGLTLDRFLTGTGIEVIRDWEFDTHSHDLCWQVHLLQKFDVKGKCHSCLNSGCQLLELLENANEFDLEKGDFLDVEVKNCPEITGWFSPRPDITIEELNGEVQMRVNAYIDECRLQSEKMRAEKAAGRSA